MPIQFSLLNSVNLKKTKTEESGIRTKLHLKFNAKVKHHTVQIQTRDENLKSLGEKKRK